MAPQKPPASEHSLSHVAELVAQATDPNLSFQGQKVGNVCKVWTVGHVTRDPFVGGLGSFARSAILVLNFLFRTERRAGRVSPKTTSREQFHR